MLLFVRSTACKMMMDKLFHLFTGCLLGVTGLDVVSSRVFHSFEEDRDGRLTAQVVVGGL